MVRFRQRVRHAKILVEKVNCLRCVLERPVQAVGWLRWRGVDVDFDAALGGSSRSLQIASDKGRQVSAHARCLLEGG